MYGTDISQQEDGTEEANLYFRLTPATRYPFPESLENHFYKLKCEELRCYTFALLMRREVVSTSAMHIDDIKAIYAIKTHLQSHLDEAPDSRVGKKSSHEPAKNAQAFQANFWKGSV